MSRLSLWPAFTAAFGMAFLALIATFNFALDPFHLFRTDRLYVKDVNFQRYVNAGIIRTEENFDAIVVGTSYIANFNTAVIDPLFGVRSRVIAVYGASPKDVSATLLYALAKNPHLKTVFLGNSIWGTCGEADHAMWPFPARLYRDDPLGHVPVLLTRDPTVFAFHKLLKVAGFATPIAEFVDNVADVPRWDEQGEGLFGLPERLGVEEVTRASTEDRVVSYTPEQIASGAAQILRCFERHVLSMIRQYPNTHFHVFNPPIYQWWLWARNQEGSVAVWNRVQELIGESFANLRNADYYDFFAATEITNDCTRFRDSAHFDPRSGDELAAMIKHGKYRRTPDTNASISQRIIANVGAPVACRPNFAS